MSAHNATDTTTDTTADQHDRRRRRKALLAGGVVLGLGAAMTLAAWSDNVFSSGTFQTGNFDLVGSKVLNSSTFADYQQYPDAAGAADLTTDSTETTVNFSIDSLNMSPGETVVAPFSIATTEDTTADGRFWLQSATPTGPLSPFLSFNIVESATCTADDPTTAASEQTDFSSPWKTGTFTATGTAIDFQSIRSQATAGHDLDVSEAFGNQVHLCVGVTLADDEAGIMAANANGAQGQTTIVWQFHGESQPTTA